MQKQDLLAPKLYNQVSLHHLAGLLLLASSVFEDNQYGNRLQRSVHLVLEQEHLWHLDHFLQ